SKLTRSDSTLLHRLRANCAYTSTTLHRISRSGTPNCARCNVPEDLNHTSHAFSSQLSSTHFRSPYQKTVLQCPLPLKKIASWFDPTHPEIGDQITPNPPPLLFSPSFPACASLAPAQGG
ncbi:hypothetical protein HPB47_001185, partial [Ixodes persulcatus]